MSRNEAIKAAHESVLPRLDISLSDFSEAIDDSEVLPVVVDGVTAGAVIVKGPEVHACILPWACGRWFTRKWLRVFENLLQENGRLVTSATTEAGERFVSGLGFERCGAYWVKHGN